MKKTPKTRANLAATLVATMTATLAQPALADSPAEIASAMMQAVFVTFDAKSAEALIAPDYIQHNPYVPTGRAPILGFIPTLKETGITLTTHRVISEGDFVVLHNSYGNATALGGDDLVAFDIFRLENGVVVEHWDNITALTAVNPSGHLQMDGPSAIGDLADTAANKALVSDFITSVLVNGDMAALANFFDGDQYIQHNSLIGDGLSGLGTALNALAEQGISMEYTKVHRIIAQGDFVFAMSEGRFAGTPTAFFDLFRVENGKIAEHWDVMADIPAEMAHDNGKF